MGSERLAIIYNPVAGRGRARRFRPQLERLLTGVDYQLMETTGPGHATQLATAAVESGFPVVVAAGGDGTMGEVVDGIAGTGTALGLIPLGTGNDLARTLGIPLKPGPATRGLPGAARVRIDLGQERESHFAILTGLGFPATVMHHVNTHRSPLGGPAAIALSVYRTVRDLEPFPLELEIDDWTWSGISTGLFVLNTRYTGGGLMIAPDADAADGLLNVVIMKRVSRLDVCTILPRAYRGGHVGHPGLDFAVGRRIVARTTSAVRKIFDGNVFGSPSLEVSVLPGALEVLVPRATPR